MTKTETKANQGLVEESVEIIEQFTDTCTSLVEAANEDTHVNECHVFDTFASNKDEDTDSDSHELSPDSLPRESSLGRKKTIAKNRVRGIFVDEVDIHQSLPSSPQP
ncbi:hypothetical protein E3N88_43470 [Mikania micrantha]|uniref:Uncharacterized protein n=1 Tax=Mikania micrantha TaxID=192012 RepID=A0A5N6LEZ4_9ASTR|nr:hypothetical protein E3N88_43470 [Mikania micrantha]